MPQVRLVLLTNSDVFFSTPVNGQYFFYTGSSSLTVLYHCPMDRQLNGAAQDGCKNHFYSTNRQISKLLPVVTRHLCRKNNPLHYHVLVAA